MAKRIFWLIILIIVLLSVNWFRAAEAQDLSSLSEKQKAELLDKYRSRMQQDDGAESYRSPRIFEPQQPAVTDEHRRLLKEHRKDTSRPPVDTTRSVFKTARDSLDWETMQSDEFKQWLKETSTERENLPRWSDLKPFGQELFQSDHDQAQPVDIATPSQYVLGPGDNVIIFLWGRVEKEYNLVLDREGKVVIPKVGEITGWGQTLEQFASTAKRRLSEIYTEFECTVTLGQIRSIRVFVAGEVMQPGAFNVPAVTSLLNVIYTAGGPNERGSMRKIKLMRNGDEVATVDLYRLLLHGDNSSDIRLQSGDLIFVPVVGPQVQVRGEVKRSAIFELAGGETAADLLMLAGQATALAHLERVMLERVIANEDWQVLDIDLTDSTTQNAGLELRDGDRMTVYSIFEARKNMVAIAGQVKREGYYERSDSTRISDLIAAGELQPYDVYYERANLFRRYPDKRVEIIPIDLRQILSGNSDADIFLQDRDSLYVYAIQDIKRDQSVYVDGEVNEPGKFPLYDRMTAADLIFLAGSYTRSASRLRAELARVDSLGEVNLIYLDLDDPGSLSLTLQEDDRLFIRQIPEWEHDRTVELTGEVMYPGKYTLSRRDETLYQILQRAGGFTRNAFPVGLVLERQKIAESLRRMQVPSLLERSQPIVRDSLGNLVKDEVFQYDPSSVTRVIIDMEQLLASQGRDGDVVLEPNDRIYVPSVPSGISVMGAVGANGTINYNDEKKVKYYIERAGNFTRQSDKDETRLIRASGEVFAGGGTLDMKVKLGDAIIVPTKIEYERDWLKTATTALGAVTGVLTSVYIISNL